MARKSGITIKLEGFDELLQKIERAGGTIDGAAETCLEKSAQIMQEELRTQMEKSDVPADLINRMPSPKIEKEANRIVARVGYEKGSYDPKNLSDGFKIIFLNYGTPKRTKHGKITARGFIARAKKKAATKIKKQQEDTLNDILGGLKK